MSTKEKRPPSGVRTPSPRRTPTRQPARRAAPRRNRARAPKRPSPEVVYTQPKPFSRGRFLLRLLTVLAVVLALTFGMSIFFKVKTVTVSGAEKYTPWEVRSASGIREGESLITINDARIGGRIISQLPYVNQVRIGIKLPDTVNIEIVELDVVYAVEASDGSWWLMSADGRIVEKTNAATAGEHTKVLGVQLESPAVDSAAVAAEPQPETAPEEETGQTQPPPVTVRGSERLSTALTILQYLEENGIIGQAASVDVSQLGAIEIWYGRQYQALLGDTTQLAYKVKCLKQTVDQLGQYQSGVLDISFTTWPDEVGYNPFTG